VTKDSIVILNILLLLSLWLVYPLGAAQEKPALLHEGQQIFNSICSDCHRSNGEGLPDTFPALKGNAFVMGDPGPVIQTILNGRKGKMGRMPTWKDTLTDQQIAAVATYIRNSWGNTAGAVTPAMVAADRQK
jgi:mono/diheme cytochrome c family protein